ncbi:MerR family transcriptional regulator [Paenibacillus polymyxa]|uniref:MerR family transcriptional regulator n=1 Tax=Paenibacillus polymyxa TaxID=1406 RepID=A0AAE9L7Q7_PAEPO|nr:MerR family transcriptional regulator [Paenibacillus polymyxa]URJ39945.1 MerR family transcriptional regulator [Paenibacillus polymyxa]URJ49208.1 MerR family transcriptional regulator [Paenibacillus polymyxa]
MLDQTTYEPKYTVKDVSEMTGLTKHTIRYYDDQHLIPFTSRNERNIRLFSEHDLDWLRMVHSLRISGLPISEVKHYIDMCLQGDETIPQRAELIAQQEEALEKKIHEYNIQLMHIKKKKAYYQNVSMGQADDTWNPVHGPDCGAESQQIQPAVKVHS